MFDFANWLCGTPDARSWPPRCRRPPSVGSVESATITVEYADGSVATVHYSGVGAGAMPKERVEVLRGGRSWVLDDFRALTACGAGGERDRGRARAGQGPRRAACDGVLAACRGRAGRSSRASAPPTPRRASRSPRSTRSPPARRWTSRSRATDRGWRGEGSLRCGRLRCLIVRLSARQRRARRCAPLGRCCAGSTDPKVGRCACSSLVWRWRSWARSSCRGSTLRPGRCRVGASTACAGHSTRSNTTDPSSRRSSPIRRNWCRPAAATTRACISWSRGWPTRSAGRIRSTSCAGWRWSRSVPRSRCIRGSSASYRARSWPRSARPSCFWWGCGSCRWATSTGSRRG